MLIIQMLILSALAGANTWDLTEATAQRRLGPTATLNLVMRKRQPAQNDRDLPGRFSAALEIYARPGDRVGSIEFVAEPFPARFNGLGDVELVKRSIDHWPDRDVYPRMIDVLTTPQKHLGPFAFGPGLPTLPSCDLDLELDGPSMTTSGWRFAATVYLQKQKVAFLSSYQESAGTLEIAIVRVEKEMTTL